MTVNLRLVGRKNTLAAAWQMPPKTYSMSFRRSERSSNIYELWADVKAVYTWAPEHSPRSSLQQRPSSLSISISPRIHHIDQLQSPTSPPTRGSPSPLFSRPAPKFPHRHYNPNRRQSHQKGHNGRQEGDRRHMASQRSRPHFPPLAPMWTYILVPNGR